MPSVLSGTMFKIGKSGDPALPSMNPFDSDSDSEKTSKHVRSSSAPVPAKLKPRTTPTSFPDTEARSASSASLYSYSAGVKKQSKNSFHDAGWLESQSTQDLENYAVHKAEEVTKDVNTCLKIAGDIREDATKTLITLHQQGEQITGTHATAARMDHDLSVGEKLLGSLGGMFSKTWKPKKTHTITGPKVTQDGLLRKNGSHLEQKERLGLISNQKRQSNCYKKPSVEPSTVLEKIEMEKAKQDDAFTDLSNMLGQLKDMAIDMGSEIERQNIALDHLDDDVHELVVRVDAANRRGRHLLRK